MVETILGQDEDDNYPDKPPPVISKEPPVPSHNSMSPPAPNVSSPPNKSIPVTSSSDQGYYLFSPDDDESSSEGDYDEDETVIGAGDIIKHTQYLCYLRHNALRWASSQGHQKRWDCNPS